MKRFAEFRILIAPVVIAAAVAGCAVGPDFKEPEAPRVKSYTRAALPAETESTPGRAGTAQRFEAGQEIPAQWWTLFHSDALDRLIRQALEDSPSLAAAQATLRQAQENLRAEIGVVSPSVDAKLSAQRERFSFSSIGQPNVPSTVFNLYNASVAVSYTFDVGGGWRRELEAMSAQVDYQGFQLQGAHLALTANIVTTAIREASLRAQMQALQEIETLQQKELDIMEQQFTLGGARRSDVLAQRAQLVQTRTTLPPLEKELALTRHQLAVLVGKLPSEADLPEFTLESLELPPQLPVSLPSELVRQRPDVRAAEALLHQASAQVGVATANLYPRITLSGNYGSQANQTGDLFGSSAGIWSFGASLLQPLFHGGELTARRRAAIAVYDQTAAQYSDTVLRAFQSVADTLRALEVDARALKLQVEAASVARDALELTSKEFTLGGANYLSLLNAERQYQQTRISLVQSQALRYADTAALFQALGGGWWNRPPPDDAQSKNRVREPAFPRQSEAMRAPARHDSPPAPLEGEGMGMRGASGEGETK
ncbi:MAG TPA: efflux transporter outer membrane subunit [Candidatus Methylomirabilis sp.]|nr:efflux transporter outer membrane subunit [Candidatus Methylomirabilis sp.]